MKFVWLSFVVFVVVLVLGVLILEVLVQDNVGDCEVIIVEVIKIELDSFIYFGFIFLIDVEDFDFVQLVDLDDLLCVVFGVDIFGGLCCIGQMIFLWGQGWDNIILLMDGVCQNFSFGYDGVIFVDFSLFVGVEIVCGLVFVFYGLGVFGGVVVFCMVSVYDLFDVGESWGFEFGVGY